MEGAYEEGAKDPDGGKGAPHMHCTRIDEQGSGYTPVLIGAYKKMGIETTAGSSSSSRFVGDLSWLWLGRLGSIVV